MKGVDVPKNQFLCPYRLERHAHDWYALATEEAGVPVSVTDRQYDDGGIEIERNAETRWLGFPLGPF